MRGKKYFKRVVLTGLLMLVVLLSNQSISTAMAESELRVAFQATAAMSSLRCGEAWQYETMEPMFWQWPDLLLTNLSLGR